LGKFRYAVLVFKSAKVIFYKLGLPDHFLQLKDDPDPKRRPEQ
jgi:hypothetical protein